MSRVVVAIPAHNEAATIEAVIGEVRRSLRGAALVVLDDGSTDDTFDRARRLGVVVVRHPVNLGYGRTVQTAIRFAQRHRYEVLVTIDGDGQHGPDCLPALLETFEREGFDLCIGSRYVVSRTYEDAALGRRVGMRALSILTGMLTGRRIYDTTSGLKAMRWTVFPALLHWHFVDFHSEALVYLLRLGFRVGEYPVEMRARAWGSSMYTFLSSFNYPSKTLLMIALGLVQAQIERRRVA